MVVRCRSFCKVCKESNGVSWFDCGGPGQPQEIGSTHGTAREAALDFASGIAKENVINITVEYDERNRRVVCVFYWK